ncbi:DUF4852 domain-containing protein [Massilia sp. X63]|uniref:DUF4852 domain-containing protein n=1 Tax=Massilia sp. X63 TaxID=3237285 RepID=UPI0034DCD204
MHTTQTLRTLIIGATIAATLAGCAKKEDTPVAGTPAATAPAPTLADATGAQGVAAAAQASLPKGDPATPLSSYQKINSGNTIMFLYYGILNLPTQYDKIAEAYSAEYRRTSDGFQRKDILKALQPRIDQEIGRAKANRYVVLEQDGYSLLSRYDFDKKSFGVNEMSDERYTYFNDNSGYTLGTTNAAAFSTLPIADEAVARKIEAHLSKNDKLRMEVYAYAQDADPSSNRVKLEIMKMRLYGPGNELLAER